MKTIGITGVNGFVGKHLFNKIKYTTNYRVKEFERSYFYDNVKLKDFVASCDVIIHLAGINRSDNLEDLYKTNIEITENLINELSNISKETQLIYASSTQGSLNNRYGESKLKARQICVEWAVRSNSSFTGLLIPNIFGPFCRPFYNSVVATFSYQICQNLDIEIKNNAALDFIYIDELVNEIINIIEEGISISNYKVKPTLQITVSDLAKILQRFKLTYLDKGLIPNLSNTNELNLFNTFRSYIDNKSYFPKYLNVNIDKRGKFTEIIKFGNQGSGQISFSTTLPGITRGNHFHTRKIERFIVIKGKALIQLRKVGESEVFNSEVSGDNPSYIDMPIWYTHNITNISNEELITIFWINENYDAKDTDTFFEIV